MSLVVTGLGTPQIRVAGVWVDPPTVQLEAVWPLVGVRSDRMSWFIDFSLYDQPAELQLDYLGSAHSDYIGEYAGTFQASSSLGSFKMQAKEVPEPGGSVAAAVAVVWWYLFMRKRDGC